MIRNKGQFISLMVIVIAMPIIALSLTFSQGMSGYGEGIGSMTRTKSAYYYYSSVENDLERAGGIIGERATVAALDRVVETGQGLDRAELRLKELFLNGTLYGNRSSIMNDSTIYDWLERTEQISRRRGFILDFSLKDVEVTMANSYQIGFRLNYTLTLRDKTGVFSLEKSKVKTCSVPLSGLEDPLITSRTGGRLVYFIERSPHQSNFTRYLGSGDGNNSWTAGRSVVLSSEESRIESVSDKEDRVLVTNSSVDPDLMNQFAGVVIGEDVEMGGFDKPYVENFGDLSPVSNGTRIVVDGNNSEVWEIENLYRNWRESYYISGQGPSFLDRLENNLTNSYPGKGLTLLIKKEDLEDADITIEDRSNLDHIYFSDESLNNYKVKGMPTSFLINEEHREELGLNNDLAFA
ncbi:MAG: hypothetical protein ACLFS3_01845 [Candidatus Aenigmatarchaeota archaeon]